MVRMREKKKKKKKKEKKKKEKKKKTVRIGRIPRCDFFSQSEFFSDFVLKKCENIAKSCQKIIPVSLYKVWLLTC